MPPFQNRNEGFSEDTFGCPPRLDPPPNTTTPRSEVHSFTFNPQAHHTPLSPLLIASPFRRDSRWDDDIKLFDPLELFRFKREAATSEKEENDPKQEEPQELPFKIEPAGKAKRGRLGKKTRKGMDKVGLAKAGKMLTGRQTKIDQYWKASNKKGGKL